MLFPRQPNQRPAHPFQRQSLRPNHQQPPNERQGIGQLIQNVTNNKHSISSMANKGVDGLSKTLGHVQQVMQVVNSAAPVVQQYGPMVKNLPTMYRIMKAFKQSDSTDDEVAHSENLTNQNTPEQDNLNEFAESNQLPGESKPKLFI